MSTGADPTHRRFVSYIDKSRDYYRASGYENPYQWATHDDTPFTALPGPLARCRLGVLTTSSVPDDMRPADWGPRLPKRPFAFPADPVPARMFTHDLFWHKDATHTDDTEVFLPLRALAAHRDAGRVGSLSEHFYGVPTDYSVRRTREQDAPALEAMLRADGVDVALLVPL